MKLPMHLPLLFDGRHYDRHWRHLTADIPFWLNQARKFGGPILELACGTGRVSLPLAKAGFAVTGVDISDSMLAEARKKAAAAAVAIEWLKADMRSFDLGRKFPLVIFPFNTIAVLHGLEDLEACLSCVKQHLAPGGRFIIDVFHPSLDILRRDPEQRFPHCEYPAPDGQGPVVVTESTAYDATHQINRVKLFFKFPGQVEEAVEEFTVRVYFPQELDALLKYNGLAVESKFGNYDESPFAAASPKQLIICSVMG